jgi:hypothetical protein
MNNYDGTDRHCPLCGEANQCRIANGCAYKGACWCEEVILPVSLQRHLANTFQQGACFCRECLRLLSYHASSIEAVEQIVSRVRMERSEQDPHLHENDRLLFTRRISS